MIFSKKDIAYKHIEKKPHSHEMRATLRSPTATLPRPLRGLGHITDAYLASLRFAKIRPIGRTSNIRQPLGDIAKNNHREVQHATNKLLQMQQMWICPTIRLGWIHVC